MIADVADEDELVTGSRHEASYFGVFYFGQQLAAGFSVLIAGGIERLAVLFGVLPAALLAIAAVWILRYTLTRARLAAIQLALTDRQHERAPIGGYAASSSLGNRRLSVMAAREGSN
jgi:Na+/melibiose symporter-like transporter